jgi:hypothetical protein
LGRCLSMRMAPFRRNHDGSSRPWQANDRDWSPSSDNPRR